MCDIDYHQKIYTLLFESNEDIIFDSAYIEVEASIKNIAASKELSIVIEKIQDRLRLDTRSMSIQIFESISSFLKIQKINNNSNLLVKDGENAISFINSVTYKNFVIDRDENLFTNAEGYLELIRFLKEKEKVTEEGFHFIDLFNKDLRKMSLISLAENGRLDISYGIEVPLFTRTENFAIGLHKFKSCFTDENKTLSKFLKSSLIKNASTFSVERRLKSIYESLDKVVEIARINFEVYINNLSIDDVKKDYDEVKSKYFNSLSDVLSKVTQKVIALPIGISIMLFSIEKVNDNPLFMIFLLVALVITSMYISLLLKLNFNDLLYIEKIFKYDYRKLLGNVFFRKHPQEKIYFEEIKSRIDGRIRFLTLIVESYYWIMNLSNLTLISIIFSKIDLRFDTIIVIDVILIGILTFYRNSILEKTT